MPNYVLVYTGGSMPETPEAGEKVMQAWGAWFGSLGDSVVDGGNPFESGAKRIAPGGQVSDGAVGVPATGYTILKAGSMDAAVAAARECPVLAGGAQITVYEVHPMT